MSVLESGMQQAGRHRTRNRVEGRGDGEILWSGQPASISSYFYISILNITTTGIFSGYEQSYPVYKI